MHIQVEDSSGQFEDDLGDLEKKVASVKLAQGLRPNIEAYIDDPDALLWDSSDEDDDEYDSQLEAQAWDESLTRVDDEDWEIAEGDFTKSYNRLRQHVEVRTGQASGSSSKHTSVPVAHLPATNRPRVSKQKSAPDAIAGPAQKARTQSDQLAMLSKYNSRIANITMPYTLGYGMGGVATNRKGASERANIKDKADRATNEQVLDPRTRIILFKMINRGLIEEVNGCVSTGKEANVYHALTPEGRHLALKIYKTSILVFKDRDKYVTGEHRFRNGYSRHNPRKMVKMWAEKEMRNLKRLAAADIRCPEVLEVKENVLVISFLGDDEGWASPRLKDAAIPAEHLEELYFEIVIAMRKMYHSCKLVHADLSEYNILFHQSHLYVIDVSQSVEHDHPAAFDFLRSDIKNIEEFWSRRGTRTLGLRRMFDFVLTEQEDNLLSTDNPLSLSQSQAQNSRTFVLSRSEIKQLEDIPLLEEEAQEDAVFLKSYIPRTLAEVFDPERDVAKMTRGEGAELIYAGITGVVEANRTKDERQTSGQSSDLEGDSENEDGSESDGVHSVRAPRGHRHEDRGEKKERKQAVKEQARQRRQNKIPKAEKKRRIKQTSSKH
ncbi:hypothetical protein BS47DRAFT_1331352 [Hydnum rufescens UP504]|uniref:Serine/threonine-protein kinase RIO1 n=1 Tax=Hydnum rufescens UP504 TaxID=1448309 RepID=A0A9P6AU89_9AGAM|nr:hypothetical protein BS47DRAFT_1331352 [Hydnum rufescens UP504]